MIHGGQPHCWVLHISIYFKTFIIGPRYAWKKGCYRGSLMGTVLISRIPGFVRFVNGTLWILCYKLKFIYSEKAKIFCEISTVYLFYVVPVKSMVEISQNFLAFSEYVTFNTFVSWEWLRKAVYIFTRHSV